MSHRSVVYSDQDIVAAAHTIRFIAGPTGWKLALFGSTRPYLEAADKGYRRLRLMDAESIGVVVESRREHR